MTAYEIIFAIREKLKEYVDDTKFTDDYLLFLIDLKRSELIRQQYNNIQRPVDEQLSQTIILPLVEVDASELPSIETVDYEIVKSTVPIPSVIELHHRNMIQRISTVDILSTPINMVSRNRFVYSLNNDFDVDQIVATINNQNYLLLKSKKGKEFNLENIAITGVFESPFKVVSYESTVKGTKLEDFTYPINSNLASVAIDMIVQVLAGIKVLPTDQANNSNDDATIVNKGVSGQQ